MFQVRFVDLLSTMVDQTWKDSSKTYVSVYCIIITTNLKELQSVVNLTPNLLSRYNTISSCDIIICI